MLEASRYDQAEQDALLIFGNRVIQAFYPEIFASLGYPMRVSNNSELWRYLDVMHETRTQFNVENLLRGLTEHEFELFKKLTKLVDEHATKQFSRRAHASAAILRAIHVLRLIKIATGDDRPAVIEVGPGCGYLAALLVLEGYPYIGTEIAQAFYLQQSHMLSLVADNFIELADHDGDITTLETPSPGTAIHIPWWKWVTMKPSEIKLSAGIMTSNHVLCEMHPSSMAYMAALTSKILANHPGGGHFVFENWGYDVLHGEKAVMDKFADYGFVLCHNEYTVSAMALAQNTKGWAVYNTPRMLAAPKPGMPGEPPQQTTRTRIARHLNKYPTLKRFLVKIIVFAAALLNKARSFRLGSSGGSHISIVNAENRIPEFRSDNPLSKSLSKGLGDVQSKTVYQVEDVYSFLDKYFDGDVPAHEDETFFELIGTRQ